MNSDNAAIYKHHSLNSEVFDLLYENMTCRILRAGPYETIDGKRCRWYKVFRKGKKGWIFGAFAKFTP